MNTEAETTTVAVKAGSYIGSTISIGSALTLSDVGIIFGIITALLTFGLNVWWVRQKVKRSAMRELREIEEHEARMKQMGYDTRKQSGRVSPKLAALLGAGVLGIAGSMITLWESGNNRPVVAYQDIVGVWTICDGITQGVKKGMTVTQDKCDEMLYAEIKKFDAGLSKCMRKDAPVNVHAAVLSFAWNVGVKNACDSTLMKKINAGDYVGGCNELSRWTKAGGNHVQGLANRREYERKICLGRQ